MPRAAQGARRDVQGGDLLRNDVIGHVFGAARPHAQLFEGSVFARIGDEQGKRNPDGGPAPTSFPVCFKLTSASASQNGNGLIRTDRTTVKTAVVAPIPSASVNTATSVKTGALRSARTA
jgi:hypothetical protein